MLIKEIGRIITSIHESELKDLYSKFCEKNGIDKADEFISALFDNDRITKEELDNFQYMKDIQLTVVKDLSKLKAIGSVGSQDDGAQTNFTILKSIDRGAMGEIQIAKDNQLGRTVAFKKIHEHVAKIPSYLERFFMEAQVTAQLEHPNIVPVYQMKTDGSNAGYAMKLIHGKTLGVLINETKKQLKKQGKLDKHHNLSARLEHFLKVCDAMHYAHRKGVIHRDLKPQNVMVGSFNEVYVMDWGIAKIVSVDDDVFEDITSMISSSEDDMGETKVGQILGTPAYMSPEQANGQIDIIDHRSDLFSLGLILFELVTLKRAYPTDENITVLQKAKMAKMTKPVRHHSRQPDIPKQLIAIINKATQLDPDNRYETVDAFTDDIRCYMRGVAIKAKRDTLLQKLMRWMNLHRIAVLNIVSCTIILSLVVMSWSFYQQQQARLELQLKGQRMNHFISAVSKQTHMIDTQFLKYESSIEAIAASAVTLLERRQPDTGRFYDHNDLTDPKLAPPDLAESSFYGFPISVGWHTYKLAPGVEYAQVENLVRAINPLRNIFKQMTLKSHYTVIPPGDHKMAAKIIKDEGLTLLWAYVGLVEGIMAMYPGMSGFPSDFDPRKRPWYVNTLKNEGACWMPPYIDTGGQGVLLPCTKKLYDKNGKFLGVAAVDIKLDFIRRELMSLSNIHELVENTYLLNDRAEIFVNSSDTSEVYERGTLINKLDKLETYPNQRVVDNIRQGKSGYISYKEQGKEKLLAYHRLNSIGWYYLVEVDASRVMELDIKDMIIE
ncbi:MAG: hypothetical protein CMF45_07000 [Legionellales bacterium]|nr:hypothetical protein [Legionellales bacterium]|tara:strand:- start:105 stop:2438 length:2334 start_codon:yes stop_codon:yes gene_type:complete